MAKTLIDVDEEQLAAAQKVLKTETKKDTVNAALRQVTALAARRRDLQRLISGAARPGRRRSRYLAPAIRKRRWEGGRGKWLVRTLADEAGTAVLYAGGTNEDRPAQASFSFPDQRWFRFLVRGVTAANAIMTAVDQAGNRVLRYRMTNHVLDVVVNPAWQLTDELVLTTAVSAPWLGNYCTQ